MRQKVVIKLRINANDQKYRTKAFKIAVSQPGVESATMLGGGVDNYKLEVVGELDAVVLTNCLKKKLGQAQLVSLGPVAAGNRPNTGPSSNATPQPSAPPAPHSYPSLPQYELLEVIDPNPKCWFIM